MIIDYKHINLISADLDKRALRNELIASNIANVDTPGYKAKDLQFSKVLSETLEGAQMKRTDPRHIPYGQGEENPMEIITDPNPGRADGNNVQIESEMLKLTKNNIQYNVGVHLVSRKLVHLKDAIREAGK